MKTRATTRNRDFAGTDPQGGEGRRRFRGKPVQKEEIVS